MQQNKIFLSDFRLHIFFPLAGVTRVAQQSISPSFAAKKTILPCNKVLLLGTPHDLISMLN